MRTANHQLINRRISLPIAWRGYQLRKILDVRKSGQWDKYPLPPELHGREPEQPAYLTSDRLPIGRNGYQPKRHPPDFICATQLYYDKLGRIWRVHYCSCRKDQS